MTFGQYAVKFGNSRKDSIKIVEKLFLLISKWHNNAWMPRDMKVVRCYHRKLPITVVVFSALQLSPGEHEHRIARHWSGVQSTSGLQGGYLGSENFRLTCSFSQLLTRKIFMHEPNTSEDSVVVDCLVGSKSHQKRYHHFKA